MAAQNKVSKTNSKDENKTDSPSGQFAHTVKYLEKTIETVQALRHTLAQRTLLALFHDQCTLEQTEKFADYFKTHTITSIFDQINYIEKELIEEEEKERKKIKPKNKKLLKNLRELRQLELTLAYPLSEKVEENAKIAYLKLFDLEHNPSLWSGLRGLNIPFTNRSLGETYLPDKNKYSIYQYIEETLNNALLNLVPGPDHVHIQQGKKSNANNESKFLKKISDLLDTASQALILIVPRAFIPKAYQAQREAIQEAKNKNAENKKTLREQFLIQKKNEYIEALRDLIENIQISPVLSQNIGPGTATTEDKKTNKDILLFKGTEKERNVILDKLEDLKKKNSNDFQTSQDALEFLKQIKEISKQIKKHAPTIETHNNSKETFSQFNIRSRRLVDHIYENPKALTVWEKRLNQIEAVCLTGAILLGITLFILSIAAPPVGIAASAAFIALLTVKIACAGMASFTFGRKLAAAAKNTFLYGRMPSAKQASTAIATLILLPAVIAAITLSSVVAAGVKVGQLAHHVTASKYFGSFKKSASTLVTESIRFYNKLTGHISVNSIKTSFSVGGSIFSLGERIKSFSLKDLKDKVTSILLGKKKKSTFAEKKQTFSTNTSKQEKHKPNAYNIYRRAKKDEKFLSELEKLEAKEHELTELKNKGVTASQPETTTRPPAASSSGSSIRQQLLNTFDACQKVYKKSHNVKFTLDQKIYSQSSSEKIGKIDKAEEAKASYAQRASEFGSGGNSFTKEVTKFTSNLLKGFTEAQRRLPSFSSNNSLKVASTFFRPTEAAAKAMEPQASDAIAASNDSQIPPTSIIPIVELGHHKPAIEENTEETGTHGAAEYHRS